MRKRNIIAGIFALAGAGLIIAAFMTGVTRYPIFAGELRDGFEVREVELDETINDLEIDLERFSLEIREGNEQTAKLVYPEANNPDEYAFTYEQHEGRLKLADRWKDRQFFRINLGGKFGGGMFGGNMFDGIDDMKIILTLPEGTVLSSLDADLDMGNALFEDIRADRSILKVDMGSVIVKRSDLGQLETRLDMGSLETTDVSVTDGSEIILSMGSMDGSMKVRGDLTIRTSMGSVDLVLIDTDVFSYDLNADMGDVEVHGRELRSNSSYTEPDAVANIMIEVDMGSIDIR